MGDGGRWLRRQCLAMAKTNCTPVQFWLSMPLAEFVKWIKESNRLIAEGRDGGK